MFVPADEILRILQQRAETEPLIAEILRNAVLQSALQANQPDQEEVEADGVR